MSRHDHMALARRVPGIWGEPGTVLYIGAAPGRFMCGPELAAQGHEITLCELWPPNVELYRKHKDIAHVVEGDVREIDRLALPHSEYDIVFWWHGPEHIERGEVAGTLAKLEALARKIVVIGCPWGKMPQGEAQGNPHQRHQCSLYIHDLELLGYFVIRWGRPDKPGKGRLVAWKSSAKDREAVMAKMYVALMRLWHSDEKRYVEAGEEVSLEHLGADDIGRLVDTGRIAPARRGKKKTTEVADGTDDRRNVNVRQHG